MDNLSTKSFEWRLKNKEFLPEDYSETDFTKFGLQERDYLKHLDKQEYEALQGVEIAILSEDYSNALRLLDNIMTDCVLHSKNIDESIEKTLNDMEIKEYE